MRRAPGALCVACRCGSLRPASYDAVLFADVDLDSYPLSHEEGPLATLTAGLDRSGVTLEPAALLRVRFGRAMHAARGPVVLARVTHDRQARECYSAAVWTELRHMPRRCAAKVACVGEGGIVADFDPAAGEGIECRRVACEAPQHLSESLCRTWSCVAAMARGRTRRSCRV